MRKCDPGRTVLGLIAAVMILGMVTMLGCAGSGETGDDAMELNDATAADLQNMAFTFADGGVFHAALANQETTLEFGSFDASNSAPWRLQSGQLIASGIATLQSPLTLTLRLVEPGLPFMVNQDMRFNAQMSGDAGNLVLADTQADTTATSSPGTPSAPPPLLLQAMVSGTQVVPPVNTTASGDVVLAFNAAQTRMVFALAYTGLTAVQEAHIHVGAVGDTGDVILVLCTNLDNPDTENAPACPAAAETVTDTLTAAALLTPGQGAGLTIRTFADAVEALRNGNTYIDVHTQAFPNGAIRGQIVQESVPPPPTQMVSFAADILPIFTSIDLGGGSHCSDLGCHAGSAPAAGLNLTASQAYNNLVRVPSTEITSLRRVEPGDPDNSYLFRKHTGRDIVQGRMPLTNPTFFDDHPDLLELERLWIEQGALNN